MTTLSACAAPSPVGRTVAELYDFFSKFHHGTAGRRTRRYDAVAVAHVAQPGIVETTENGVAVETQSDLCRGRTVVDLWRTEGEPNTHVAVDIDADARSSTYLLGRLESLDAIPARRS